MFCWSLFSFILTTIHAAAAASTSGPTGCISFDVNWNLLVFGINGKDYNAGTVDTWSSSTGTLTDITSNGRPPFNSANVTCYLSQFTNATYVLNADSANPSSIYIYDASAQSWSTQKVNTGKFDPSNFAAILDHDTNVFYAYSNTELYLLDMGLMKSANSTALSWVDVQQADLSADTSGTSTPGANTNGYQPVMALAQNHVHFLNVPGFPAGTVKIFVIHFSFMQPAPQLYGNFPNTHGRAASFFRNEGVQEEFAFIPDDGSSTYVINVQSNTTKTLTGPTLKDALATYGASTNALVQLSSSGKVSFLAYDPSSTTSGGTWTTISKIPTATFSSPTSGNGTSGSASGSASGAGATSTGSSNSGSNKTSGSFSVGVATGAGVQLVVGMSFSVLLGLVGLVL